MVEQHPVSALPWYARADYPTLLRLFSDLDKLPATSVAKGRIGCGQNPDSPGSLCGLV
jgi:hypothetical protein